MSVKVILWCEGTYYRVIETFDLNRKDVIVEGVGITDLS